MTPPKMQKAMKLAYQIGNKNTKEDKRKAILEWFAEIKRMLYER